MSLYSIYMSTTKDKFKYLGMIKVVTCKLVCCCAKLGKVTPRCLLEIVESRYETGWLLITSNLEPRDHRRSKSRRPQPTRSIIPEMSWLLVCLDRDVPDAAPPANFG